VVCAVRCRFCGRCVRLVWFRAEYFTWISQLLWIIGNKWLLRVVSPAFSTREWQNRNIVDDVAPTSLRQLGYGALLLKDAYQNGVIADRLRIPRLDRLSLHIPGRFAPLFTDVITLSSLHQCRFVFTGACVNSVDMSSPPKPIHGKWSIFQKKANSHGNKPISNQVKNGK